MLLSFECGMSDPGTICKRYFGFDSFRPPQGEVIDHVLSGRHALLIMPTGGGKSLCYQVPALTLTDRKRDSHGMTLVISPLIALMKDQVDALCHRGVDATFINSSLSRKQRLQRYANVAKGKVNAFGLDRLRDQLDTRGNRGGRLETALAILDRWGVIEGSLDPLQIELTGTLPESLASQDHLDVKLKRDQQKLYALLQYVKTKEDRKGFIHHYFGLDSEG